MRFYSDVLGAQGRRAAERDWEEAEASARANRIAEERERDLEASSACAPRFELHRLPLNFWLARITEMTSRLHLYSFPELEVEGARDLRRIDRHTLFFRSDLPEDILRENVQLMFLPF